MGKRTGGRARRQAKARGDDARLASLLRCAAALALCLAADQCVCVSVYVRVCVPSPVCVVPESGGVGRLQAGGRASCIVVRTAMRLM